MNSLKFYNKIKKKLRYGKILNTYFGIFVDFYNEYF